MIRKLSLFTKTLQKLNSSLKLRYLFVSFLLPFCCFFTTFPAYADDICNTNVAQEIKDASGCSGSKDDLSDSIANILKAIIGFIGIIAVIFIVVGGINYMTSLGDPQKTLKARNTILYACIGLAICALAFAIVDFVIVRIIK